MELFNEERRRVEPPNFGEQIFEKLNRLPAETLTKPTFNVGLPRNNVRYFLEQNPNMKGPLDATEILNQLGDDDLCDFFARYNQCQTLIIKNWKFISTAVLRCISVTMGDCLQTLDVSGSAIGIKDFEVILAFSRQLKVVMNLMYFYFQADCHVYLIVVSTIRLKYQDVPTSMVSVWLCCQKSVIPA